MTEVQRQCPAPELIAVGCVAPLRYPKPTSSSLGRLGRLSSPSPSKYTQTRVCATALPLNQQLSSMQWDGDPRPGYLYTDQSPFLDPQATEPPRGLALVGLKSALHCVMASLVPAALGCFNVWFFKWCFQLLLLVYDTSQEAIAE
jgi:hypothetical protein